MEASISASVGCRICRTRSIGVSSLGDDIGAGGEKGAGGDGIDGEGNCIGNGVVGNVVVGSGGTGSGVMAVAWSIAIATSSM